MPEIVTIALPDLLVDQGNARLREEKETQQTAMLALAKQQDRRLLKLAEDIVNHGLDPTALPAVVRAERQANRYIVVEGNRRVVALKALETPAVVAPAFDAPGQKRLHELATKFQLNPVTAIPCVLFSEERELEELDHWVTLRHTGQNQGVGLVEWGSDEQDRYAARHGRRSREGQVLDFVEKHGLLSDEAVQSRKGIITSLRRLLNNPRVREVLGIEFRDGNVVSWHPDSETAKGLSRIVDDLKTGRVRVGDIYHAPQRVQYAESLPHSDLPDPSTRLDAPIVLGSGDEAPRPAQQTRPKRRRPAGTAERPTLIPTACRFNIGPPRIEQIYVELRKLRLDQFTNACSVSLRVFLELSVDHYLRSRNLRRVRKISRFKSRITLTRMDAAEYLQRTGPDLPDASFLYLDPPYYVKGAGLYENSYAHEDHVEVAGLVRGVDRPWVVSYDAAPEILHLYQGHQHATYNVSYSAGDRYRGGEVMFFGPGVQPPDVQSPANIRAAVVDRARRALLTASP